MAPKLRIILLKTKVSSRSRGSYEPQWDIPKRVAMRRGNDRVARSLAFFSASPCHSTKKRLVNLSGFKKMPLVL